MPLTILVWVMAALLGQQSASSPAAPALDYEYFKARVEPIFLAKREGHARCYSCHSQGTPMRLQEIPAGRTTWSEEESRKNFEAVIKMVNATDPMQSRLLLHPLATEAGGTLFHNGGKHFDNRNNTEWQTLLGWVKGQKLSK
jgi:hypothetical protein